MIYLVRGRYYNLFKYILQSSKIFNKVQRMMTGNKSKARLTTVADAIDALGKRSEAARFFRVSEAQICNMLKSERVSGGHQLPLLIYLHHKGYDVDIEKVFGLEVNSILDRIEFDQVSR